jgi:acyl dehydratase
MVQSLYFEDLAEGQVFEAGPFELSEARIIEFANEFDPQSQHTDPEKARDTPFEGLAASGWHTAAATMRLMHDAVISRLSGNMGLGVDGLKWARPVRPGDRLTARITVGATRLSGSRPGFGIVPFQIKTLNQDGKPVMQMTASSLVRCRG